MTTFSHPGALLKREYLMPAGLKNADLARATGLPTGRISEIINGKRDITAEIAYHLEQATNVQAQLWLGLQNDYDLWLIGKKKAHAIKKQTSLLPLPDFVSAE